MSETTNTNTDNTASVIADAPKAKRKYTKNPDAVRVNSTIDSAKAQTELIIANDIIKKTYKALGRVIEQLNAIEDGAEVSMDARNSVTDLLKVADDTEFAKVLTNAHKVLNARLVTLVLGKG